MNRVWHRGGHFELHSDKIRFEIEAEKRLQLDNNEKMSKMAAAEKERQLAEQRKVDPETYMVKMTNSVIILAMCTNEYFYNFYWIQRLYCTYECDVQSKQGMLDVLEDQLRNKQAQEIKAREQKRVEFEGSYSNPLISCVAVTQAAKVWSIHSNCKFIVTLRLMKQSFWDSCWKYNGLKLSTCMLIYRHRGSREEVQGEGEMRTSCLSVSRAKL